MNQRDEMEYLRRRIRHERHMAEQARCPRGMHAHQSLADLYARRLLGLELYPPLSPP